jgi:hypothetical protein
VLPVSVATRARTLLPRRREGVEGAVLEGRAAVTHTAAVAAAVEVRQRAEDILMFRFGSVVVVVVVVVCATRF